MTSDAARRTRFEQIVAEVHDPIQRYLLRRAARDDIDDLMNDVLLVMWRRIDAVPNDPLPWCYGVARNALSNHRRASARRLRLVAHLEAQPHHTDAREGADPEIDAALASLSDADREVLRLWAWEQLEPREIAVTLGISPNAASLRLSKARTRLAQEITGQNSRSGGHRGSGHTGERRS
jgi:RNA polymerase sigma-70 factor (ECF subfamily)